MCAGSSSSHASCPTLLLILYGPILVADSLLASGSCYPFLPGLTSRIHTDPGKKGGLCCASNWAAILPFASCTATSTSGRIIIRFSRKDCAFLRFGCTFHTIFTFAIQLCIYMVMLYSACFHFCYLFSSQFLLRTIQKFNPSYNDTGVHSTPFSLLPFKLCPYGDALQYHFPFWLRIFVPISFQNHNQNTIHINISRMSALYPFHCCRSESRQCCDVLPCLF